ncbi:MAG: hypothetical protein AAF805_08015, partial [Planctomycetota bacterium]
SPESKPEAADADDDIGLGVEPLGEGDDAESILLTGDDELEGGIPRPPSTIIGKGDLDEDSDLKLAGGSDAPVAADASASFAGLEELELDLDAEASQVAAKSELAPPSPADSGSELELDLAASGDDLLSGEDAGKTGELPSLSGSIAGLAGSDADIQLGEDEDDDLVLGGSDENLSLSSGDSGINLAPSDSGFALDEVPLDLSGSAIGSQLDLASLSASAEATSSPDLGATPGKSDAPEASGDFLVSLGEEEPADEEDAIVAFDDIEEEDDAPAFEASESFGGEEEEVDSEADYAGGLSAAGMSAVGAAPAAATVVASVDEATFPGWVIGLLAGGLFICALCGVMALDLLQSMWAWEEPYGVNSALMDGLLSIMG